MSMTFEILVQGCTSMTNFYESKIYKIRLKGELMCLR